MRDHFKSTANHTMFPISAQMEPRSSIDIIPYGKVRNLLDG